MREQVARGEDTYALAVAGCGSAVGWWRDDPGGLLDSGTGSAGSACVSCNRRGGPVNRGGDTEYAPRCFLRRRPPVPGSGFSSDGFMRRVST